jgi:tRNA A-37 threonylcarbamoyl transferase component Bud32
MAHRTPSSATVTRTLELPQAPPDSRTEALFFGTTQSAKPAPEVHDSAANRFVLERGRAIARSEHSAAVHRLRQAVKVGIPLWSLTGLLDWWVTSVIRAGNLKAFLALRALGTLAGVLALWRLTRPVELSPRRLLWIDLGIYTWVSLLVSVMCISFGGISSPYATGLITILVARGATLLAPWWRGAWLLGVPAMTFPMTLLVAAAFDETIRAQFTERVHVGLFVTSLIFIATALVFLTLGSDFAWRLRREALETRNIGRYKLERRVGGGGMGEVWAAYDITLKQRVALKTLRGQEPGSSAVVRFEREVRALAELTHPNTVRVFDHGVTEDGLWYYAMELLRGENLRELVEREGPLAVPRLLGIARQILRALGEAHMKGIIHRDIKPDNVFVAELGGEIDVPKLLDFGIAQAMASDEPNITHTGWLVGTPAYMPPEVIRGLDADVRSDIYSFGATLYFALTAQLPFPDGARHELFEAHLHSPAPLVSIACPRPIPPQLERIIQRCMAKNPTNRYASTQAVLEELRGIAAQGFDAGA